jgi:hypothetical protein
MLIVKSLSGDEIPNAILFERRGEWVGYRLTGALTDEIALSPPVLNGSLDSLHGDLEEILVGQGLYRDEAHAMVETWKDSWFEEGSRLIYIVPCGFIDNVLPVTIDPEPGQVVRVFVARLEIVTPRHRNGRKNSSGPQRRNHPKEIRTLLGADSPNHRARTLEKTTL